MEYQLPDGPVDQMEIVAYKFNSPGERIRQIRYIYHVNTPWRTYDPTSRMNGADLIDDWMLYTDGSTIADGRIEGWLNIQLSLGNAFATKREASLALIPILEKRAEYHRKEAARIEMLITGLQAHRAR